MTNAIFLDRDGTLIEDAGENKDIEKYKLLEGVVDGLKIFRRFGFKLIVVTNQSGIGRGYYTEESMHKFHDKMIEDLEKNGVKLDGIYFCPHHPDKDCECRKPKTGMIDKAVKELGIEIKGSFMIGDKDTDVELAHKAGMKGILIQTDTYKNEKNVKPDYKAKDLVEAADYIREES